MNTVDLLRTGRLWRATEVLTRPSPVPAGPGVYGWRFDPGRRAGKLVADVLWTQRSPEFGGEDATAVAAVVAVQEVSEGIGAFVIAGVGP
ncbi:hypothetical protein [Streptosporangium sp. NPDC049304]|uniref:hypothetical protein n=1 Tax=Streptosporangium sp. NPDC049304 TaxID=3154830 RepID=UPI0034183A6A